MSDRTTPSPSLIQRLIPLDATLIEEAENQILEQSRRIDFYITEYSVELLVQKLNVGDFYIPPYQRQFTWDDHRQSRFIESVLMGLPVPFLFFWEQPESGTLEIVDGSQRLRTLQAFLNNSFELGDLAELSLSTGLRFSDLPLARQRKFRNRSIRGIVLNEHTDAQSRFDLFERINTSSKNANSAEVRRGAMPGRFTSLVIELAQDQRFKMLAPRSAGSESERDGEELVSRFFAWGDGLENYRDRVAAYLWDYTKQMNSIFESNPSLESAYRDRFHRTMNFVDETFPHGFRRSKRGAATPNTRFEAIAVGSHLALMENPNLEIDQERLSRWFDSPAMISVLRSDGANAVARLRERLHFVRDHLLGSMTDATE